MSLPRAVAPGLLVLHVDVVGMLMRDTGHWPVEMLGELCHDLLLEVRPVESCPLDDADRALIVDVCAVDPIDGHQLVHLEVAQIARRCIRTCIGELRSNGPDTPRRGVAFRFHHFFSLSELSSSAGWPRRAFVFTKANIYITICIKCQYFSVKYNLRTDRNSLLAKGIIPLAK